MNNKKAIFPGSFDPLTTGHIDIVLRATNLFDEIIVAIGNNSTKSYMFSLDERLQMLHNAFGTHPKISIATYEGLTVDFCKNHNIKFIIRGLRNTTDFVFEQNIALMNKALFAEIETIFISAKPELAAINSSIVREIIKSGGDASMFMIPKP